MTKKLGFGCMRLPLLDKADQTSFDCENLNKQVDTFIEKGFSYFDAAYTYHSYHCEEAVHNALVDRHSRDQYAIATKMPMRDIHSREEQSKIFDEQLTTLGVNYFDYYLLHNIGKKAWKVAQELDTFEYCYQMKQEGKIKKLGMSFHDTPELLEEILEQKHDRLDFVQLQINYIDWENPAVQSRRCYEVAVKYNLPVIVMEPCKGGVLVNVPEEAEKLMKAYHPELSIASWAIRFAASQDGVFMVLSGMNTMEQVLDNTSYMDNFNALDEKEMEIIKRVVEIINAEAAIPCTACRYCEHGCPMNIAIPDYFALYNSAERQKINFSSQQVYYINLSTNHGKAKDCIDCKQCEKACPQHLPIVEHLKDVSKKFDTASSFPTRK